MNFFIMKNSAIYTRKLPKSCITLNLLVASSTVFSFVAVPLYSRLTMAGEVMLGG